MPKTVRTENEMDVEWLANKKAELFRPGISPAGILIVYITLFFCLLFIKIMPDDKTSNFYNKYNKLFLFLKK
jgi:hypothetical protein